jgi:hypothetical protein
LVASATGTDRTGPRNLAILACVCMALAGPVLAIIGLYFRPIGDVTHRLLQVGPILEVYEISGGGRTAPDAGQWRWITIIAVAAGAAWAAQALTTALRGRVAAPE